MNKLITNWLKFRYWNFIIVFVFLVTSCSKEDDVAPALPQANNDSLASSRYFPNAYSSDIVQGWYTLLNRIIIETPGNTPPVAARVIGYTGLTLYEAAAGNTLLYNSLSGQLNGLQGLPVRQPHSVYAHPVSGNAAIAKIIKLLIGNLSPALIASVDSLEQLNFQYYSGIFNTNIMNRSSDFGHNIADAIFNWSVSDGGHQAYLNIFPPGYIPPAGNGFWVPTPSLYQSAMLPYWGANRTFVPANGPGPVDPGTHPLFSSTPGSDFYNYAYQVYTTGNNLTQVQRDIANFWADGGGTFTPPGHDISIVLQIIRNRHLRLGDAVTLIAKTSIALNDAAIVCWRAKFNFNLLRPVTYIQTYIDPSWTPYISTPPFPSYTSGHSTFTSATCKLLSMRFGSNYSFSDSTKVMYGYPVRSFSGFDAAAREATNSRMYGGIHYEFDNEEGYQCGKVIALNVAQLNWI
jgi:hypothetical protein